MTLTIGSTTKLAQSTREAALSKGAITVYMLLIGAGPSTVDDYVAAIMVADAQSQLRDHAVLVTGIFYPTLSQGERNAVTTKLHALDRVICDLQRPPKGRTPDGSLYTGASELFTLLTRDETVAGLAFSILLPKLATSLIGHLRFTYQGSRNEPK